MFWYAVSLSSANEHHVGQHGRVAVIGGSEDYTGAPYFSAMASAKLGCDMVCILMQRSHYRIVTDIAVESCNMRPWCRTGYQVLFSKSHGTSISRGQLAS